MRLKIRREDVGTNFFAISKRSFSYILLRFTDEYDKTRRIQKQLFCQFLVNPVVKSRKIVRIKDEVNKM